MADDRTKMKLTNTGSGPRGFTGDDGEVVVLAPGETREVEVSKAVADNINRMAERGAEVQPDALAKKTYREREEAAAELREREEERQEAARQPAEAPGSVENARTEQQEAALEQRELTQKAQAPQAPAPAPAPAPKAAPKK